MIGPGYGTAERQTRTLRRVLSTSLPVLVDADALTMLAEHPDLADLVASRPAATVLTPHAGEFARLAGGPPGPDRVDAARSLAVRLKATVLLKGNVTVIARPDGTAYVNRAHGSWAATAGSGDVLAGVIGALLSAGIAADKAAAMGPMCTPVPPLLLPPTRVRVKRPFRLLVFLDICGGRSPK